MTTILELILSALASALFPIAEKAIQHALEQGETPIDKRDWVKSLVTEIGPTIAAKLPPYLQREAQDIDALIEDAIDGVLDEVERKFHAPPPDPTPGGMKP